MEWVLRSPQVHSTFGSLGYTQTDGYHINENCDAALEIILHNILTEDKFLRTYRRNISFGQNVSKDLIPLLIHAKQDSTIKLLIQIFVHITIPTECLLCVETLSKTDFGRHTIFEIDNLLTSTKAAFADHRATKVIIDFLKKHVDINMQLKLSQEQCFKISNSLLLLRNILHIPDDGRMGGSADRTVQNQILWNMFSQSVDKILIRLMVIPEASEWVVTMVQLVALLYKDQHVATIQKHLSLWLETSLSDSSEDNESNTSPPARGSNDFSPMLTSDRTSDSSDTEGSGKGHAPFEWLLPAPPPTTDIKTKVETKTIDHEKLSLSGCAQVERMKNRHHQKMEQETLVISESSDCGYGTGAGEAPGSASSSGNERELPRQKVALNKLVIKKHVASKLRTLTAFSAPDRKRRKIIKRGKSTITNVQGLSHMTPTDDDISTVLKEFTVDFLLRGYNCLVRTLHQQLVDNPQLQMDTSHFFWLLTYFLKLATQIELGPEMVSSVLTPELLWYLTAAGVALCEQVQLAVKLDSRDLTPNIRRLHLAVTAVREFVQAVDVFKKLPLADSQSRQLFLELQVKVSEAEELRSLLVLLLRHYDSNHHTKQYLQDLIITNHLLSTLVDDVARANNPGGGVSADLVEHLRQLATPAVMSQYGLMLEDYATNSEFVNDCVFTVMHHVAGELDCLISLFQPKILKIFTSIWKSEFEICDDWTDLIEYVINTFVKKPDSLQSSVHFRLDPESFDGDKAEGACVPPLPVRDSWTEEELSSLNWNYMQCSATADVVGGIVQLYAEDGTTKSRGAVLDELFNQNIIDREERDKLSKKERDSNYKTLQTDEEMREDEIANLCEQLVQDGKLKFLVWVQKVLLEICYAKIYLEKKYKADQNKEASEENVTGVFRFGVVKDSPKLPAMSPVSYHAVLLKQSVPLVPYTCEQAAMCKDLRFLQLLHRLGCQMPVDTGKLFIRVPNFWTADMLFQVAGKLAPIESAKLKFSLSDLDGSTEQMVTETVTAASPAATPPGSGLRGLIPHTAVNTRTTARVVEGAGRAGPEWLRMVQQARDCKLTVNFESWCEETASMASDLTHMYVSDEEERPSGAASGTAGAAAVTAPCDSRLLK